MKNLNYLNKYRVDFSGQDEHNGVFLFQFDERMYSVIASNGGGWEHVSVAGKNETPSWEVMNKIKDLFFEEDETVMQLHPPKSEYVNNHEYCLHLWKPIDQEIPRPPMYLVGIK